VQPSGAAISRQTAIAASNLRIDAFAVEVVEALRGARVESIILKGPALAHWLGDDAARPYVDCDLLVRSDQLERARHELEGLGFEPYLEGVDLGARWTHPAWMWSRGDQLVDLHHGLAGADARPEMVWSELRKRTVALRRGHIELPILDPPACALVFALHAAHHGRAVGKPLHDLELALERFDRPVWREAARLGALLSASGAFATGLRLVPGGAAMADQLGVSCAATVQVALAAASAPPQAVALEQLASQQGVRAKLDYVRPRLVPAAAWMRASYPIARRGRAGLAAAYAWRFAVVPIRLLGAVPTWRRARKAADPSGGAA
jgi:hypothetical protein